MVLVLAATVFATRGGAARAEAPSFQNEVMAVLSKGGCNAGACHGNQNGKGGFKLSLRGQHPGFDFRSIVKQHGGRRVDQIDADASLLLRKPTSQVTHQGGRRFSVGSELYEILRGWIAAGMPGTESAAAQLVDLQVAPRRQVIIAPTEQVQIKAIATFSDGTKRDVTDLACYETADSVVDVDSSGMVQRQSSGETTVLVRFLNRQAPVQLAFIPARPNFRWSDLPIANYIDQHTYEKLKSLRMNPSELADDSMFVRRAYLDALGILPTMDEAKSFVADSAPNKRQRLIDQLLQRPEFADHWALKWSDLLKNEEKTLDVNGVKAFYDWIRESMAAGKPIDQFVRELVTARGSTYKSPPANYYRANRDPLTRAETTARLFLGTRLQCAKCHNHPFERWTQDDYYSWAALFARIDYKIIENKRTDKYDKNEFVGEQIVLVKDKGEVKNPSNDQVAPPRFLGGSALKLDAKSDRLQPLAKWLANPNNRLFAKAQANLIWYHLMGRGLVEPIDDFRATNPAVNPALLDALARDFAENNFDLRHLVRVIMNSRTYQLSSRPNDTNAGDQFNFSRAIVRRLTAEQLLDAQTQLLDSPAEFVGYDVGLRAGQIPGVRKLRRRKASPTNDDRFLQAFGKPERLLACECERSNETTLTHAFVLVSGEGINRRLAAAGNRLDRLANSPRGNSDIISDLYWTALSRPPSANELGRMSQHLANAEDRFTALQDVAWSLLNSKEFIFRR